MHSEKSENKEFSEKQEFKFLLILHEISKLLYIQCMATIHHLYYSKTRRSKRAPELYTLGGPKRTLGQFELDFKENIIYVKFFTIGPFLSIVKKL